MKTILYYIFYNENYSKYSIQYLHVYIKFFTKKKELLFQKEEKSERKLTTGKICHSRRSLLQKNQVLLLPKLSLINTHYWQTPEIREVTRRK